MSERQKKVVFDSERDLCTSFIKYACEDGKWLAYNETADFDILLVRKEDGFQIGVEAKLQLNAKVIEQALPCLSSWSAGETGPDCRAVLVPGNSKNTFGSLCGVLGVTVITHFGEHAQWSPKFQPTLPSTGRLHDYPGFSSVDEGWHEWCPVSRCTIPDYMPDNDAGCSAPVKLTEWKIRAIKLAVILAKRPVSRRDFKLLGLSPSRWTDPYTGWLVKSHDGYIAGQNMPDFKAQHPRNFDEILADADAWMKKSGLTFERQGALL